MKWMARATIRGRGMTFRPMHFRDWTLVPISMPENPYQTQSFFCRLKHKAGVDDPRLYHLVRWVSEKGAWEGIS